MLHHYLNRHNEFRVRSASEWEHTDVTLWAWHTSKRVCFNHSTRIRWFRYSKSVAWMPPALDWIAHTDTILNQGCQSWSTGRLFLRQRHDASQLPNVSRKPLMAWSNFTARSRQLPSCNLALRVHRRPHWKGQPAKHAVQFDSSERVGGE
jgi:hypothetical protein